MSDLTPRPINPGVEPTQTRILSSNDLIRRVASDLTPYQSVRVSRKIQRERAKTCVDLAKIENATMIAEAEIIARGKVRSTMEHVERLLQGERSEIIADAAIQHEGASRAIDLVKDQAAHQLFKDALDGASSRYLSGVVKRAGS